MKLLIKRFVFFILIAIILVLIIVGSVNSYLRANADFKINKESNYLIIGDSHSECAFNDSLISNFSNFSASGEAYFYTYSKIKQLIKQNDQIHTVFIEFNNIHVEKSIEQWIWSEDQLSQRYFRYAPFMSIEDHSEIFFKNKKGFLKYLHFSTKKNVKKIFNKDFDYYEIIGHYKALKGNKIGISDLQKFDYKRVKDGDQLPTMHLKYLKKIVDFSITEDVDIYLVRSPMHINNINFKHEDLFQNVLKDNFSELEFLDFGKILLEDLDYYDRGHLNEIGAAKFSQWFDSLINKGLLLEDRKQDFIDKGITN